MNQNKLSIILMALGTALIAAAVAVFALIATGTIGSDDGNSSLQTVVGFGKIESPTPGPTR